MNAFMMRNVVPGIADDMFRLDVNWACIGVRLLGIDALAVVLRNLYIQYCNFGIIEKM